MSIGRSILASTRSVTRAYHYACELKRYGTSTLDTTTGMWTEGAVETIPFLANLQPVPGHMVKLLPEGKVSEDMFRVFTEQDIQKEIPGRLADVFLINGEEYPVIYVKDWTGYTEAVIAKRNV